MSISVPEHCAIMTLLKPASVESINFIKSLKESDDSMDFSNVYGHLSGGHAKFSDILWICTSMFAKSDYKLAVSSIQLFTNIDIPHAVGSPEYNTAILKAKDLQQLNLDFRLFPMRSSFSEDFYKQMICTISSLALDEFEMPKFEEEEELMLRRLFKKTSGKRAQCHLNFKLSDDLFFGVDVFGFVRKTFIPRAVFRGRENNEPIVSKRTYKYQDLNDEEEGGPSASMQEIDYTEDLTPKITL